MTMPGMKPCPFCGGKAHLFLEDTEHNWCEITCNTCHGHIRRKTAAEARAAWNARATDAMLERALDALESVTPCFLCNQKENWRGAAVSGRADKLWEITAEALVISGRYRWANAEHTAIERV